MKITRTFVPPELRELLARCEDRYPGDLEKQREWLTQMTDYLEKHKVGECIIDDPLCPLAEHGGTFGGT